MIDFRARLEPALQAAVTNLTADGCPPRLAAAVRDAVFPAGNRLRPRLAYAVAAAIGEDEPAVTDAAAVALELLHCASLVQDDLPAFDDASQRRGRQPLHRVHGDALAILAADTLILGAFGGLAEAGTHMAPRIRRLTVALTRGTGAPRGAVAGQAWELEPDPDWSRCHDAKTAALFEAATACGAIAAGADPAPWRALGAALGRAYQVADDLADAAESGARSDAGLGRPNVAALLGGTEAVALFDRFADATLAAVPPCPGRENVRGFLRALLARFRAMTAAPAGSAA